MVVGLGTPAHTAEFRAEMQAPFPILCDPKKNGYKAYGLEKLSVLREIGSRENRSLGQSRSGEYGVKVSLDQDMAQLGGSFVLDTDGTILYAHRAAVTSENKPTAQVLAAVASSLP